MCYKTVKIKNGIIHKDYFINLFPATLETVLSFICYTAPALRALPNTVTHPALLATVFLWISYTNLKHEYSYSI